MDQEILFDTWNNQKKILQAEIEMEISYPKEGEVWMCSIGKNIGFEQNGSGENYARPVLVIKKFNNKMFWTVPLSSKQKDIDFYHNFTDSDNLKVSLILAQMKLVSIKRMRRKMYDIDQNVLVVSKNKLREYLQ